MKKKLKSTSALLQSLFDLEISTQMFHKITCYIFILARRLFSIERFLNTFLS